MKRRQTVLYMAPAVILIVAFFLGPLCYLGYVSFFEWNGLGPKTFVGIENFRYVFSDPVISPATIDIPYLLDPTISL